MCAEFGTALIPPEQSRISWLEVTKPSWWPSRSPVLKWDVRAPLLNLLPETAGVLPPWSSLCSENFCYENFDAPKKKQMRGFFDFFNCAFW